MSRERTDTAGSSNSFGLRERSHTGGSVSDFVVETRGPANTVTYNREHHHGGSFSSSSPNHRGSATSSSSRLMHSGTASSSASSSTMLRQCVDWIQRQPVPAFLLPSVRRILGIQQRRATTSISNPNEPHQTGGGATDPPLLSSSTAGNSSSSNTVYCIRGLDRVVFGTTAAADCVVLLGLQPPRYLWYMVSGAICDVMQLLIDVALHLTVFPNDAALCWMTSFCLSIIARHTSHRYLVFGDYVPNYWQSLFRMYMGYSVSIVLSTLFNYAITAGVAANMPHYVAYVATLLWTGLANYFILKKLWNMGGGKPPGAATGAGTPPAALTMSSSSASP